MDRPHVFSLLRFLRTPSPLWVGLLGMVPYVQTLWFGLVSYDDPWLIQNNVLLREPTWAGLWQIWFDLSPELRLRLGAEYLPVRDLSVLLDGALFGTWYGGHHLTNVLLYGLMCAGLARALQVWTGRPWLGWVAGLLYALHPLHVESVAWLSERKGLLAGLFVVGAALAFFRFARRPSVGAWLITTACLVLAVWSKATGISGLAMLGALLWFFRPRLDGDEGAENGGPRGRAWLALAGTAVVTLAAFVPVWKVGNRLVVETAYHGGDVASTAWLMVRVLGVYLEHLLWGGPLGIQYPPPTGTVAAVAGAVCAAVMATLAVVGIFKRGEWSVAGFAAACWWFFFLPVSQLLVPLQNYLADRYMLLASLAFCLLLALGIMAIRVRPVKVALVVLLAGLSGYMSLVQTRCWSSSTALFRQALRAHPDNIHAMIQLATIEVEAGRHAGAARWLRQARTIRPGDSRVMLHQGLLLYRLGRKAEAASLFRQAARADPMADKARANLALLLSGSGQPPLALSWARQAAKIRPLSAHNQRTLGVVALGNGLLKEALEAFRRAQQLEPHNAQNAYNMGVVALKAGKQQEAETWLTRALSLDPGHQAARGVLQDLRGKKAGAAEPISPR